MTDDVFDKVNKFEALRDVLDPLPETTCPDCHGKRVIQFSGGVSEEWRDCPTCSKDSEFIDKFSRLAAIGAAWEKDSSLEKWFPLTALELAGLRPRHKQLYELVELYLCTPNTDPIIEDHYKNLVAWFVRNKRPDGSEPLPVSPEQDIS